MSSRKKRRKKQHEKLVADMRRIKAYKPVNPVSDAFLQSYEWRKVRMVALRRASGRCECCGASPADGIKLHVDHIKPRKKYPALALDANNLQVLCEVCNHGKGNWDETDWRPEGEYAEGPIITKLRSIK